MTFHKPSWCWNRNITGELGQYNGHFARYIKLRVAHAPGIPGTFFPPSRVSNPDMHHDTHMLWCMSGFPLNSVARKTFPAFPAHAQPTILSGTRPMEPIRSDGISFWEVVMFQGRGFHLPIHRCVEKYKYIFIEIFSNIVKGRCIFFFTFSPKFI